MKFLLAQTVVDLPLPETMKWLVGLFGCVTLLISLGTLALIGRKLFGRQPSVTEELQQLERRLVGVVAQQTASSRQEMTVRHGALADRVTKTEADLVQIQVDRANTLRRINARFERVLLGLANIAGQLGTHIPGPGDDAP